MFKACKNYLISFNQAIFNTLYFETTTQFLKNAI